MIRSLLLILCAIATSSFAADYPRTVIDLASRSIVIPAEPKRILLQDSNDLMALSILDRHDPIARVAAWNNSLRSSDPSLWQLIVERWPHAASIDSVTFSSGGEVDIEAIIRSHPDLIVAKLEARTAVDNSVLGEVLERLGIPLIYVDSEDDPSRNVPRTLMLLGEALDQREAATAYVQRYQKRLNALLARTARLPPKRVFLESRAGQAGGGACCHTQGNSAWGQMIQTLGAINLGSKLLVNQSGDIALETLIRSKPDVYLMTGTQRVRNGVGAIPLGYRVLASDVEDALTRLIDRPGFRRTRAAPESCTYALYHQFYNSVFNVIGLEYLATLIWPEAFSDIDPDQRYRDWLEAFTDIPAAPFVFSARSCNGIAS